MDHLSKVIVFTDNDEKGQAKSKGRQHQGDPKPIPTHLPIYVVKKYQEDPKQGHMNVANTNTSKNSVLIPIPLRTRSTQQKATPMLPINIIILMM